MACRGSGVRVPVAPPTAERRRQPHPSPGRRGVIRIRGRRDRDDRRRHETPGRPTADTGSSATTRRPIEPRWQQRWDELGLHETDLDDGSRPRYYLLTMYPYPSGDLHIGHWYIEDADRRDRPVPAGCTARTCSCRSASTPSGCPPRTPRSRAASTRATGRWPTSRTCAASSGRWARRSTGRPRSSPAIPTYYQWNQWLFLRFLEAGLAYRAKSPVDWCPNDGTLAREQVEGADRHCWRCGAKVEKRDLDQWYLRVTKYADELLDFGGIDFPEPIRVMQTNWIGRSEGGEIVFTTAPSDHHAGGEELRVFTTRPDTLFGATFMVLAPEHPLVAALTAPDRTGRGRRVRRPGRRADRDRPAVDRPREDRRRRSARTRSTRSTASGSRSSSPTTSSPATGPARSWPSRPTTSATTSSPRSSGCRSGASSRRRATRTPTRSMAAYIAHAAGEVLVNSGHVQRAAGRRGRPPDRRRPRGARRRPSRRHVPVARLADQPPALLGHADPGHPLPDRRHRARAGRGPAGPPARHRRLRTAAA